MNQVFKNFFYHVCSRRFLPYGWMKIPFTLYYITIKPNPRKSLTLPKKKFAAFFPRQPFSPPLKPIPPPFPLGKGAAMRIRHHADGGPLPLMRTSRHAGLCATLSTETRSRALSPRLTTNPYPSGTATITTITTTITIIRMAAK
jgi:hypothetical protein